MSPQRKPTRGRRNTDDRAARIVHDEMLSWSPAPMCPTVFAAADRAWEARFGRSFTEPNPTYRVFSPSGVARPRPQLVAGHPADGVWTYRGDEIHVFPDRRGFAVEVHEPAGIARNAILSPDPQAALAAGVFRIDSRLELTRRNAQSSRALAQMIRAMAAVQQAILTHAVTGQPLTRGPIARTLETMARSAGDTPDRAAARSFRGLTVPERLGLIDELLVLAQMHDGNVPMFV